MKRSRINDIIRASDDFIGSFGFRLPKFAYFTPDQMIAGKDDYSGIINARLGWDITDYGLGKFDEMGLFLFTVRNGNVAALKSGSGMLYAEKIMISRQDQISPMHRHVVKSEDIINRGGAQLAIQMFESDSSGKIDPELDVTVARDGVRYRQAAGDVLVLDPGDSVTLMPGNWHKFWGEGGDVLIGEVSTVNDDVTDNIFAAPIGRFAQIDEDEPPLHLLVSDYDAWLGRGV
ncbi:MAG: D-lyxose/D-mannose family sugar isomerase [Rhodobacterales bacterium]|nr:D-lyxose/D-mannose family sugar isomerase [Rhodobacterales bacterium]